MAGLEIRWIKVAEHLEFVAQARMTYSADQPPSDKVVAHNNLVADVARMIATAIRAGLK